MYVPSISPHRMRPASCYPAINHCSANESHLSMPRHLSPISLDRLLGTSGDESSSLQCAKRREKKKKVGWLVGWLVGWFFFMFCLSILAGRIGSCFMFALGQNRSPSEACWRRFVLCHPMLPLLLLCECVCVCRFFCLTEWRMRAHTPHAAIIYPLFLPPGRDASMMAHQPLPLRGTEGASGNVLCRILPST